MTTRRFSVGRRKKLVLKSVALVYIFFLNGCVSSGAVIDVWNDTTDNQSVINESDNSNESNDDQSEASHFEASSESSFDVSDISSESNFSIDTSNEDSSASEPSESSGAESKIEKQEMVIYLTFDDGPSKKNSEKILQILKEHDVNATFFVVGDWAKKYPDIIKQMHDEGHNIGCHSMTHDINNIYNSSENFIEDINEWEKTINEILGQLPEYKLYRFPGGSTTANINGAGKECFKELKDRGYFIYDWSAANCDKWLAKKQENETLDEYLRRMLFETIAICKSYKRTPCVVLMHETSNESVKMLDWALTKLQEQGYTFGNLGELGQNYTFTTY